jgi:6,7-dimethyl-8-ribityllumazine synthase
MITHAGSLDARGLRFGVVAARFNSVVTDRLLDGALRALREHGAAEDDIEVMRVPGAFELPLFARLLAGSGRIDAVICLGAIIKGETPHFDYISTATIGTLSQLMLHHDVPVVLGVLTTDDVEQALARADETRANKGFEAAATAVEMASLRHVLTRRFM